MNMDRHIKRGEVYVADLSPVVGSEQGGIRPVIVLQNDKGNEHSPTTIVAAITSSIDKKSRLPTHIEVECDGLYKKSIVLLEQIKTIDKSRLREKLGFVGKEIMGRIDYAIIKSLGVKPMEELL